MPGQLNNRPVSADYGWTKPQFVIYNNGVSKSAAPHFSIVIPCYNEANYIGATLDSLQAQDTTASFEIIIVDNNCSDQTVSIASNRGTRIITEKTSGVCCARQAGTQAARGEIVISTDADTLFSPHWLSTIEAAFQRNSRCIAVAGPCRYYNGPWWGKAYPRLLFGGVYWYYRLTGRPFYITATNIAFKKSAWEGYDVTATQGGDELTLLHSLRKKGKIVFNNSNPVFTSARRLKKGLLYNVFATFLFYYLGAYYINRLFGRIVLGPAPAYRENSLPSKAVARLGYGLTPLLVLLAVGLSFQPSRNDITHMARRTAAVVAHKVSDPI